MSTARAILMATLFAIAPTAAASPGRGLLPHEALFDPFCLENAELRLDATLRSHDRALSFVAPAGYSALVPLGFRAPVPAPGQKFASSFALISGFEVTLLVGTMMLPKSFTGWEDDFVEDGVGNLGEAWSRPPVWDTDHWFHNYVGHPYGGSIYYNTLRARGGTPFQSFVFSATMSAWWEYALEAVAERPSIQDLVVTPVAGSLLGEFTHRLAVRMRKDGSGFAERIFLTVLNPTHMIFWRDR